MAQSARANVYAELLLGLLVAGFIILCFGCDGGLTPEQRAVEEKRRAAGRPGGLADRSLSASSRPSPHQALAASSIAL
jgi:hypothetical protein